MIEGKAEDGAPRYQFPDLKGQAGVLFDKDHGTCWVGLTLTGQDYDGVTAQMDSFKLPIYQWYQQSKAAKILNPMQAAVDFKNFVSRKFK